MSDIGALIGSVLLVIIIVILGPLGVIWSLNTLFGLTIPFTLNTWAASACLSIIIHGSTK